MLKHNLMSLLAMSLLLSPEGEGTGGAGEGGEQDPNAGKSGEEELLTQEQFDAALKARLERERQQTQKKLQQAGFNSLDELEEYKRKQDEQKRKKLEEEGNYKELMAQMQREHEEKLRALEAEKQNTARQLEQERIQTRLLQASQRAHKPEQVVALLRNRVRIDSETGDLVVLNEQGKRATDGAGNLLSIEQMVTKWLDENPHFLPPSAGRGGNSGANGSGSDANAGGGTFVPGRDNTDAEKLEKHRDEILEKMRKGELRG